MNVEVNTNPFCFSHTQRPGGRGSWFFSATRALDFRVHVEGVDYFSTSGLYSEAKRAAVRWAAARGLSEIFVQP